MLLFNRELPQDETARRIRSLPHILILSSAWTTHAAATSITTRDAKHLAADIVWYVTNPWLVSKRQKINVWERFGDLWGECEGVYIVGVRTPSAAFKYAEATDCSKDVFSLGEGKACPDLELSMKVMWSLKAETLIEIKTCSDTDLQRVIKHITAVFEELGLLRLTRASL